MFEIFAIIHPDYFKYYLIRSHYAVPLISGFYLLFVLKWGPQFMKNRPRYNIQTLILCYNALQVLINGYLFTYLIFLIWKYPYYNFGCILPLPYDHIAKDIEIRMNYVYVLVKIFDYLDTVFFVLRKSFRQITVLHVFHHVLMTIGSFYYLRVHGPAGQATFLGILNTFVHFIMYGYYLYTSLKTDKRKSIWWKKHLTQLQIFQFFCIFISNIYPMTIAKNCKLTKLPLYVTSVFSVIMGLMFVNFYYHCYIKQRSDKKKIEFENGHLEKKEL